MSDQLLQFEAEADICRFWLLSHEAFLCPIRLQIGNLSGPIIYNHLSLGLIIMRSLWTKWLDVLCEWWHAMELQDCNHCTENWCVCVFMAALVVGGGAKFMMNSSYQSSPDFKDFLFCRACILRLTGLSGAKYLQSGIRQESTFHCSTFTLHCPHQTALTHTVCLLHNPKQRQVRLFQNEHISMERHWEKILQNTLHSVFSGLLTYMLHFATWYLIITDGMEGQDSACPPTVDACWSESFRSRLTGFEGLPFLPHWKPQTLQAKNRAETADPLTSFWFGEAFVQVKNNFLHKVLNVAVLRSSDKHHPVVGEAFHGGFLSELGTVTKL